MTRLVIVGGSDAATESALGARSVDPDLEIEMIIADGYFNYSICGLPFLVSGEVDDRHQLAHRTSEDVTGHGIEVSRDQRARSIDVARRVVEVDMDGGGSRSVPYDRLVIATGARPVLPAIRGLDDPAVHVLHTMDDGIALRSRLDEHLPAAAIVLGGGYIGVEMADALTRRGLDVTLVGHAPSVLPTIDPPLGALLATELERNGVTVMTGASVDRIDRVDGRLEATITGGRSVRADLVVVGAGVRPQVDLARSADVSLGPSGAIRVTRQMRTNIPDVYAAGDCVETWHAILGRPTYLPLGTTAHKQGRVAGEQAAGADSRFAGSVGTQVVKVFDLAAARTGLTVSEASAAGLAAVAVDAVVPDHKPYYPGARDVHIRIIGDPRTGKLLGAQMVGHWQVEVAKRIDIVATALHNAMSVRALLDLDLSYTPPLSTPWDPVQAAADAWLGEAREPTQAAGRR